MGEPITDPLLLQQIENEKARSRGAITDPDVIAKIEKAKAGVEPTAAETAYDVARQGVGHVSQGLANLAMLPLRASAWLTGTQGKGLAGLGEQALSPWLNQPDPETTAGRYAGAVGEAIGSTLPLTGAALTAARGLPAVAPAVGGLREAFLRPFAEAPGKALGIDVASAAGGGALGEALDVDA